MIYYTKLLLIIFLAILFLSGCAYHGAYVMPHYEHTATFGGMRYISLREFCDVHGFKYSVDQISRIAEVGYGGTIVKIMPDSNISLINGSVRRFSPSAKLKDNIIYIPPSFATYLEKDIFKRKIEIPYVKRYTIKTIVIDPGHGGKDPGAIGRYYNLREKDIVLDVSKKLRDELRILGDFKIILTRESDNFVSLWKRSEIANNVKADLFISIHANASRSRQPKGFEIFYLSDATDDSARAIAAAENEAIAFENNFDTNRPSYLDATVWDMTLTENRDESQELAKFICGAARKDLWVNDRGVKSARFYVLNGTRMPAVLVEVGFISNKEEEWNLRSSEYRSKVAEAISRGILAYKDKYEKTEGFTKNSD